MRQFMTKIIQLRTYYFFLPTGVCLILFGFLRVPELPGLLIAAGFGCFVWGMSLHHYRYELEEAADSRAKPTETEK